MVFLKSHSWTSVGYNYLISAWVFQVYILFAGFWRQITEYYHEPDREWHKININMWTLICADFCAGACMITFGGLLGKVNLF